MSNAIRQVILFPATVNRVYRAILDQNQFAEVTGAAAEISDEVGGAFSCFDGQITGRHIELSPDERIVQAWRVKSWGPGEWSRVRFEFKSTDEGTELTLDQAGYPEDARDHLESGWHKMYWEPLRSYLAQ